MKKIKIIVANLFLLLFTRIKTYKWERAIKKVAQIQQMYLFSLLEKNKKTEFGFEYKFNDIDSVKSFQKHVPINSYDDIVSYIKRITEGVPDVLTSEKIDRFGVSSGSVSTSKLIPYTKSLSSEFQKGINPWLWYIFKQFPDILFGKTYWSVSPVGQKTKYTESGIPIGFDDENMYFSKFAKWALTTIQVAPPEISLIKNIDSFWYTSLRFILEEKKLTWISIWNPTFIILCLSNLEKEFDSLIKDIREGTLSIDLGLKDDTEKFIKSKISKNSKRAEELVSLKKRWGGKGFTEIDTNGQTFFETLWPKLLLISCWADGEAINVLPKLRTYFPNVAVQPKGLIATEAFVSFPFTNEKSALSINSHFFEFEIENEMGEGDIKLAHELELGKQYSVIVTTGGGLYRYRLNDIITVLGFKKQCPLIRFSNRKDKVVDIMGEKLNEQFVKKVVVDAFAKIEIISNFWIVSPEQLSKDKIAYTIFIQNNNKDVSDQLLKKVATEIELQFMENYHYKYCRYLGQLDSLKVFRIFEKSNPDQVYLTSCLELGQRLGDIKTTILHSFKQWSTKFQGRFL